MALCIRTYHSSSIWSYRSDNLILDSFDLDWNNTHPSSLHHLKELTTVYSKLKPGCLIVVDDNHNGLGKGQYVADFLSNVNDRLYFNEYQIGYIKLWFLHIVDY